MSVLFIQRGPLLLFKVFSQENSSFGNHETRIIELHNQKIYKQEIAAFIELTRDLQRLAMFEIGGKCLAYHGPMLYEAKILKIWDPKERKISMLGDGQVTTIEDENELEEGLDGMSADLMDGMCYFVHYQGWKSTWDEWIGPDRIHEYNEENLALKKSLVEEARNAKKLQQEQHKKKKAVTGTTGSKKGKYDSVKATSTSTVSKKTNGLGDSNGLNNTEEGARRSQGTIGSIPGPSISRFNVPRIILHIPVRLKSLLVDDWEFVTKDKKICQLPSPTMTVDQTLTAYEESMSKKLESPAAQSQLSEYCAGLKLYFEKSLPILLLYRLERLQYDEILKKERFANVPFCKIYGPIHLLRLLSLLPELMTTTTMDSQSCQLIVKQTEGLLEWLVENNNDLFDVQNNKDYYVNTSSQYEGVALGM